jgi:hypothetical protein
MDARQTMLKSRTGIATAMTLVIAACGTENRIIGGMNDPDGAIRGDGRVPPTPDASTSDKGNTSPDPDVSVDPTPDSGPVSDADSCWEAWKAPEAKVTVAQRPPNPGMIVRFWYEISPQGKGTITLDQLVGHNVVRTSDGPFSPGTHSGSWAELRDASDQVLFTQVKHKLVPESVEIPPPPGDGGFSNVWSCPTEGGFQLDNLPNTPEGTQIVLFSEPIDGQMTHKTVELARFQLP